MATTKTTNTKTNAKARAKTPAKAKAPARPRTSAEERAYRIGDAATTAVATGFGIAEAFWDGLWGN